MLRCAGIDVSRETLERLETYAALVAKWSPRINLVSRGTLQDIWSRHILDSAQIAFLAGETGDHWADLGSGAGLPGMIVAFLRPELSVTCVESDQRKVAFLRTVSRETDTKVSVVTERIERLEPLKADVLSARALATLPELLSMAERHLAFGGTALFPKGASFEKEVENAREAWHFDCEIIESKTSGDGVVLKVTELQVA